MYHSEAWLVDDCRDPALETNITTTVTGAATCDPLFEPDPKIYSQGPDRDRGLDQWFSEFIFGDPNLKFEKTFANPHR